MSLTGLFAHKDYIENLRTELRRKNIKILLEKDLLFITEGHQHGITWAQQIWQNSEIIEFASIKDAANKLKIISKTWMPTSIDFHRRTMLICENFKTQITNTIKYNGKIQTHTTKSFILIESNKMLVSSEVFPAFQLGQIKFEETKDAPSRAYLKLWETFTVHQQAPKKNELCIDLGSCPGGWTWVLAKLGCEVHSVDKAPLDPRVERLKNVTYIKKDAFQLTPEKKYDWLFSDIICDPKRLYELVQIWREAKAAKNYVCTIKFKGKTDFETMDKFLEIPNARVVHLTHNKHEVTFILCPTSE